MILEKLSLINYKNIREATLDLSPKINCMIGSNGVGKTNILDAVYFLSFCHSASMPSISSPSATPLPIPSTPPSSATARIS